MVKRLARVGELPLAVGDLAPGGGCRAVHPLRRGFFEKGFRTGEDLVGKIAVSLRKRLGRVRQGDVGLGIGLRNEGFGREIDEAGNAARAEGGGAALIVEIERGKAESGHRKLCPREMGLPVPRRPGQRERFVDDVLREKPAVQRAFVRALRQASEREQGTVDALGH